MSIAAEEITKVASKMTAASSFAIDALETKEADAKALNVTPVTHSNGRCVGVVRIHDLLGAK